MRVVNKRRQTITEYDLTAGYLQETKILKPDAIRLGAEITVEKDGKTITQKKRRYDKDDFEIVQMYIPNYVPTTRDKIAGLKKKLSATDYKVIKCSECQLMGAEMPYDVAALHAERQALRDEINKLEQSNTQQ